MIKLFSDGADKQGMLKMYKNLDISGFTTNPTLMHRAGIQDYEEFAKDILKTIKDKPVSFEVFADDYPEMKRQALKIASWGPNVYVKIPITNTKRESSAKLISYLSANNVKLNVTAILTIDQVKVVASALDPRQSALVSIFAGRIADTGSDPIPIMAEAIQIIEHLPKAELLWASPREVLNIYQADAIGCHIITATNEILNKLALRNKDLNDYSHETVQMFYNDAQLAGFEL
jgi:transaldolase